MKKILVLVALIIITASLFASEYITGTVKNNEGFVEDAGVYFCIWHPVHGWVSIDSCQNDPVTGYYSLDLADAVRTDLFRVSAYIQDHSVTIHKQVYYNGGSIVVNFIYAPGNQD